MNPTTLRAIYEMFTAFGREASEGTALTYAKFLSDLDAGAVCAGVERLILTSEFLPTIAAIRREVTAATRPHVETEDEAWALIRDCLSSKREWASLPPLVSRIMRLIGTSFDFRNDEKGILETRFRKAYAEARKQALADLQAGALPVGGELAMIGGGR